MKRIPPSYVLGNQVKPCPLLSLEFTWNLFTFGLVYSEVPSHSSLFQVLNPVMSPVGLR